MAHLDPLSPRQPDTAAGAARARPLGPSRGASPRHAARRPSVVRAVGRTTLLWAGAWALVIGGLSATIEDAGDVVGLKAFWPLVALIAGVAGALSGAVYAALRRWVRLPGTWRRVGAGDKPGVRGRVMAAAYGALAVGALLLVTGNAIFAMGGTILGACTAFVLPGEADL